MLVLALIPAGAHAQAINKCRNPQTGAVAYTSNPCPATASGWKDEFEGAGNVNDRDRMSAEQANASIERSRQAIAPAPRVRSADAAQGAAIPIYAGACEEAKRARDRRLYALGAGVSIEVRRMFDEDVRRACRW